MDDGSRIRLHLFEPSVKLPVSVDFEQLGQGTMPQAQSYLHSLTEARHALSSCLEFTTADSEPEVESAASCYISLLLGMVNSYAQTPGTPALDQDTESRLAALLSSGKADGSAAPIHTISGNSPARKAVNFQWQEVLLSEGPCNASDAVYELASVLISLAVWKQKQAVRVTDAGKSGSTSEAAIKAYNLLRSAAGLYQCAQEYCSPLLANICASLDCNAQVLKGQASLALADAQSITVLRAIQKGNAPNLIAGLSNDTAQLYQNAAQYFRQTTPGSQNSKSSTYADWKALVFQAYAYAFAGTGMLASFEGGKAVRCAQEATAVCKSASKAAALFDQTSRQTPASQHQHFDTAFGECIMSSFNKCKRDNDVIYYKHIPEELPVLPEPKRLATATTYTLPAPAQQVAEGIADACFSQAHQATASVEAAVLENPAVASPMGASQASVMQAGQPSQKAVDQNAPGNQHADSEGTACWRWLLVIIAAPLLLIISLVGIVVWLVLLPLKICCCPVGMCAQLVWDAFEWLIKAPLRGLLWASGKPWKPDHAPPRAQNQNGNASQV